MADVIAGPLYSRADDVISTEVGGSLVLLSTRNWVYYEFDSVGAAIWGLLNEPHSLASLVTALIQKFNVHETQCLSDTRSFLKEMMDEGIVTECARV